MLLIALASLALVWLGVLTVVIGACLSAARADRALVATSAAYPPPRRFGPRLGTVGRFARDCG